MKDGGMAYPQSIDLYGGMTMRQRYKIAAMQGLLASDAADVNPCLHKNVEAIVGWASNYADALIAEDELHAQK